MACVNGYFVAIEVKAPNGKPSELQKYNVKQINEGGGFAVIVRPDQWEQFKELVEHLLQDDKMRAWIVAAEVNQRWKL